MVIEIEKKTHIVLQMDGWLTKIPNIVLNSFISSQKR